ncbi:hypothetical protein [Shewanella sp. Shew256]|uniref:hypothetical protein n=1 Tax=Shewanella sp. Shew256 TaxID=1969376 RepID=UPI000B49C125|nr:hypothetical protein [Shewanella sp. Shew256]
MRFISLVFVVFLFIFKAHANSEKNYDSRAKYVYINSIFSDKKFTIYRENNEFGTVYSGSDVQSEAIFCNYYSEFYCVTSFDITFSVPKDINLYTKQWQFKNKIYSVSAKNQELTIWGKNFKDVYIIDGPMTTFIDYVAFPSKQMKFVYSKGYGLLGFGYNDSDNFFWSVSEKGFGSHDL